MLKGIKLMFENLEDINNWHIIGVLHTQTAYNTTGACSK
jgi:hypothetical protein